MEGVYCTGGWLGTIAVEVTGHTVVEIATVLVMVWPTVQPGVPGAQYVTGYVVML